MSDDAKSDPPKQKTPKGLEIPVPSRKVVNDALSKLANAPKPLIRRSRPKK